PQPPAPGPRARLLPPFGAPELHPADVVRHATAPFSFASRARWSVERRSGSEGTPPPDVPQASRRANPRTASEDTIVLERQHDEEHGEVVAQRGGGHGDVPHLVVSEHIGG